MGSDVLIGQFLAWVWLRHRKVVCFETSEIRAGWKFLLV